MIREPLGTRDAARIAGKHQRTIVAWIRGGKLPAWKHAGPKGPYVIDRDDLMEAIRKWTVPQPYDPKETDGQPS